MNDWNKMREEWEKSLDERDAKDEAANPFPRKAFQFTWIAVLCIWTLFVIPLLLILYKLAHWAIFE